MSRMPSLSMSSSSALSSHPSESQSFRVVDTQPMAPVGQLSCISGTPSLSSSGSSEMS